MGGLFTVWTGRLLLVPPPGTMVAASGTCVTLSPTLQGEGMQRDLAFVMVAALSTVAPIAGAQATGTATFNAPYRAFTRSEIGALLSFPDGGGTGIEGAYRMAGGRFDFGFKAGFFDPPGPGHTELLLGAEARQRVITHTLDLPLHRPPLLGGEGEVERVPDQPQPAHGPGQVRRSEEPNA